MPVAGRLRQQGSIKTLRTSSRESLSSLLSQIDGADSNKPNAHSSKGTLSGRGDPNWLPIRERLRAWCDANPQGPVLQIADLLTTATGHEVKNGPIAAESTQTAEMNADYEGENLDQEDIPEFGEDFDVQTMIMNPGDLIEARSSSVRSSLVAIYICHRDGLKHFYASDGSWYTRIRPRTYFVVPGFATAAEIAPIKARLPPPGTPVSEVDELISLGGGPTREDGQQLLNKMGKFLIDVDVALQENHLNLDDPFSILSSLGRTHINAHEAAEHLLSGKTRGSDGTFPQTAIYAVHRAMQRCEFGVRVYDSSTAFGRRSALFEVRLPQETESIFAIEKMIRKLYADPLLGRGGGQAELRLKAHKLGNFILQARRRIDRSRKERQYIAGCDILGPSRPTGPKGDNKAEPWLSPDDEDIMSFMHIWAVRRGFDYDARANGFAAQILKAIGRYKDFEYLDQSVGWLFLQEIGWILPWDVSSRHYMAVPGTTPSRAGGLADDAGPLPAEAFHLDRYPGTRKDWGDLTAFAVDSADTEDIDDAVSVERTSTPGQYWIHVHVADVASVILPDSPHARNAEIMAETHYFPGHRMRLFTDLQVREHLSLRRGTRALTFSGLVNDQGELLEYKVTPGVMGKVINITPEEVAKICPGPDQLDVLQEEAPLTMCVGPQTGSFFEATQKKSTSAAELDTNEVEDLKLLDRLVAKLPGNRRKLTPPGKTDMDCIPQLWPANTEFRQAADGTFQSSGDMTIQVARVAPESGPRTQLVERAMLLAGEIAGRWCHDRGIPVPYRTMPQAVMNKDVLEPWVKDYLYPRLDRGEMLTRDDQLLAIDLIGPVMLSTDPASHFWLGLDHYIKVTSPLRRYLDLIAHLQIHAALAEEARTGKTLKPPSPDRTRDHPFLPISRAELAAKLPLLATREAKVRALSSGRRKSHFEYVLQALARAFYFGEAPLPQTFEFRVGGLMEGKRLHGVLPELWGIRAILHAKDLNSVVELHSMLNVDDIVEVKLKHISTYHLRVYVEAIRVLRRADEDVTVESEDADAAGGHAVGQDVVRQSPA